MEGQKNKDSVQSEKHITQLEAALREAAGAIQRHDKEMKKMIDRLQVREGEAERGGPGVVGAFQRHDWELKKMMDPLQAVVSRVAHAHFESENEKRERERERDVFTYPLFMHLPLFVLPFASWQEVFRIL